MHSKMSTEVSNLGKILSFMRDRSSCEHSLNVIFQCKDGQLMIQSLILIAASNFWKNLLLNNTDNDNIKILIPDIERNALDSILSVLYEGFASNRQNISSEVKTIFPDLDIDIAAANSNEVTRTFHKNEQSEMTDRTCGFCFQYFARKESCLKHTQRMHIDKNISLACEICGGNFKTKETLAVHTKLKHSDEGPPIYKCETCEKIYRDETSLRRHVRINNHQLPASSSKVIKPGYQKCKLCDKVVGRLSFHMKKYHASEHQTFPCNKCDQKFDRKDVLYKHEEKVHSTVNRNLPAAIQELRVNEEEWKCKMCGKSFYSVLEVENHLLKRNCSKDLAIKYNCELCEKSYKEKHNLTKHIKNKHTVKEKVTCLKCGKKFQLKSSLTRHNKICVAK